MSGAIPAPILYRCSDTKHLHQEVKGMTNVSEVGEIYRCEICGNVVEVKEVGGGELICCGEPMVREK